jgi:DNA segregation ATPase FtsK/SpoIIIE-like protein
MMSKRWWRKFNKPMVVAGVVLALGVFLLLSLVSFERHQYEHPEAYADLPNLLYSTSKMLFSSFGGASYFLVALLLAWSVIVFFRERDGEILLRLGGAAVLLCATATLFALWGNDYLGGALGAGVAGVLRVFPGTIVGSILVSTVFVVSFIVATDWLFYAALREALTGPDLMRDDDEPFAETTEAVEAADELIEEQEHEDEEGDGDGEREMVVGVEEDTGEASAAVVPPALRKVMGRGPVEVEPSDVEFADDEEEHEPEPRASVPPPLSVPEPEDTHVPVGSSGHEIEVEVPDVEFADPPLPAPSDPATADRLRLAHEDDLEEPPAAEPPPAETAEPEEELEEPALEAPAPPAPPPSPPPSPEASAPGDAAGHDEPEETPEAEREPPSPEASAPGDAAGHDEPEETPEAEREAMEVMAPPVVFDDVVFDDEIVSWDAPAEPPAPEPSSSEPPAPRESVGAEEAATPPPEAEEPDAVDKPEVALAEEEPPPAVADRLAAVWPEPSETPPSPDATAPRDSAGERSTLEPPVARMARVDAGAPPERKIESVLDALLGPEPTPPATAAPEAEAPQAEPPSPEASPPPPPPEATAPRLQPADEDRGFGSWFRRRKEPEAKAPGAAEPPSPEASAPRGARPRKKREPETPNLFDPEPVTEPREPEPELLDRAARLAIERGRASVVLFQRRLGIGYARARTLVDRLVEADVLGPMSETGSHPVLVSEEAWTARGSSVA